MTDPNPLKQAAEEAKARKLAEVKLRDAAQARETTPASLSAQLLELTKIPFKMRIEYDPGRSFEGAISDARINFVDPAINSYPFERPRGGSVRLEVSSIEEILSSRSRVLELMSRRNERLATQEELLGIASALRNVQGSFLIASGIFYGQAADGLGMYDASFQMVLVIDGDDRSIVKMNWDDFVSRPGHILAVVKDTVPRPSELRARSGSMP